LRTDLQRTGSSASPDGPKRPGARDNLRLAAVRACLRVTSGRSLRSLQACGRLLAPLVPLVSERIRRSVRTNLALCFTELTPRERRRLERRVLQHGLAAALELGLLWNLDQEHLVRLVRRVDGLEDIAAARAAGRGVLMVGPHLGAWELAGIYLGTRMPMTMLYRPPRLPALENLMRAARERCGSQLVPAGSAGMRTLFRALQRGEAIGVLPDQDPGASASAWAPFFGVPARTTLLVARLLQSTQAAPFLAWAERLPRGQGFHLHLERLDPEGLAARDDERAAAALNRALEGAIRRRPEQYLWSYRRFRRFPDGGQPYREAIPAADSVGSGRGVLGPGAEHEQLGPVSGVLR